MQSSSSSARIEPWLRSTPYARSAALHDERIRICETTMQPAAWPEHSHREIQICTPLGPARPILERHTAGGRTEATEVGSGRLSVVPAGQPHRVEWPRAGGVRTIYLAPELLAGAPAAPAPELRGLFGVCDRYLSEAMRLVANEAKQPQPDWLYIDSITAALAAHLVRRYRAAPSAPRIASASRDRRWITRAVERIHADLAGRLRIRELAGEAGLSEYHFARRFRDAIGESPHRFITKLRMERARGLLARTDEPIIRVAARVGYASQSRFAAAFKRATGMTPTGFRRESSR